MEEPGVKLFLMCLKLGKSAFTSICLNKVTVCLFLPSAHLHFAIKFWDGILPAAATATAAY